MAQSEDERKSLENELDRMKEYTQLFSVRLEEISSDVDQVESLKKSAIKEEHQYNQLSKIAQNLRNEIFNLEDSFKTTVEDTKDKVNDFLSFDTSDHLVCYFTAKLHEFHN